jgi:hypothetical protein
MLHKKPQLIALCATTLVGLTSLLASAPASAEDTKTFSPMACVPNGPPSSLDNQLSYSYLGLLNTSEVNNLVVTCPLEKDADDNTNDPFGEVVFSYQTANSKSGVVNCTVQIGAYGTSTFYSQSSAETTQGPGEYNEASLDLDSVDNYLPAINLVCSLSPRTRLTRIIVRETLDTDETF